MLHFQSCHDEEEDGEEVKSFEVGVRVSRSDRLSRWKSRLFQVSYRGLSCCFCIERRRRWRSRSCCISRLDCMNVGLQKWCFRPSAPAKVGLPLDVLQHTFYTGSTRTAAQIGLRRNTAGGVFTKKQLVLLFFGLEFDGLWNEGEFRAVFVNSSVIVCTYQHLKRRGEWKHLITHNAVCLAHNSAPVHVFPLWQQFTGYLCLFRCVAETSHFV